MPSYTFEDFIARIERSSPSYTRPYYFQNQALFQLRPEMLTRAVCKLPWEKGCALLGAAVVSQTVPLDAHRAALTAMLRHNAAQARSLTNDDALAAGGGSRQPAAGRYADWRAALSVLSEAHQAHGQRTPSRLYVSALRLLAPTRRWEQAIAVLKAREAVNEVTAPMLLDAAHCLSTEHHWDYALRLVRIGEAFSPHVFWPDTAPTAREVGYRLLAERSGAKHHTACPTKDSQDYALEDLARQQLYPTDGPAGPSTARNPFSMMPPGEDEPDAPRTLLPHSAMTSSQAHPEDIDYATRSGAPAMSLEQAKELHRLDVLSAIMSSAPPDQSLKHPLLRAGLDAILAAGAGRGIADDTPVVHEGTKKAKRSKGKKRPKESESSSAEKDAPGAPLPVALEFSVGYLPATPAILAQGRLLAQCFRRLPWRVALTLVSERQSRGAMTWTPGVLSATMRLQGLPPQVLAHILSRLPPSLRTHREVALTLMASQLNTSSITEAKAGTEAPATDIVLPLGAGGAGGPMAALSTFRYTCGAYNSPLPSSLASRLVMQLWQKRETMAVVEALRLCAATKTRLTPTALMAGMECALIANTEYQRGQGTAKSAGEIPVHWLTALTWVSSLSTDAHTACSEPSYTLMAHATGQRTAGNRRPPPVHPRLLSPVLLLCARQQAARGGLALLEYAATTAPAGSTLTQPLLLDTEIRAVLQCALYDRPQEAALIVATARRRYSAERTRALELVFDAFFLDTKQSDD